jgi:hypothetical protein
VRTDRNALVDEHRVVTTNRDRDRSPRVR